MNAVQQISNYLAAGISEVDVNNPTHQTIAAVTCAVGLGALGLYAYSCRQRHKSVILKDSQSSLDNPVMRDLSKEIQIPKQEDKQALEDKHIILDKNQDLTKLSEEEIKALCKQYHVQLGDCVQFRRFLKLHIQLWKGSERYREIVLATEKHNKEPIKIMDRLEAAKAFEKMNLPSKAEDTRKFKFAACWNLALKSVILMEPEKQTDAYIGRLLAFEMTNGYHHPLLSSAFYDGCNGKYDDPSMDNENARVDRGATLYAHACRDIENTGMNIHQEITNQAIDAGFITPDWRFNYGQGKHDRNVSLTLSDYGQSHIDHYKNAYRDRIFPAIQANRRKNLSRRMDKLRAGMKVA